MAVAFTILFVFRSAIKSIACKGFNYHGFLDFGTGVEEPEFYCVPDPATLIQLPWKPEFGWMAW